MLGKHVDAAILLKALKTKLKEDKGFREKAPDLLWLYDHLSRGETIEINGVKWSADTLITATSNRDEMKVFYGKDVDGWWPADTAVLVVARNEKEAHALLGNQLRSEGFSDLYGDVVLRSLDISRPNVVVVERG